eukprot:3630932-Prymnesium_polylepis.2
MVGPSCVQTHDCACGMMRRNCTSLWPQRAQAPGRAKAYGCKVHSRLGPTGHVPRGETPDTDLAPGSRLAPPMTAPLVSRRFLFCCCLTTPKP